jgi:hypothetical protein
MELAFATMLVAGLGWGGMLGVLVVSMLVDIDWLRTRLLHVRLLFRAGTRQAG